MENATNGLIMAGSVLIGIIIISLFVYMFSSMGNIAKDFQESIDEKSINKFNENFEKYIGRNDLTTYDVLSIYNLVQEINEKAGMKMVELKGITKSELNNISDFLSSEKIYSCSSDDVKYSDDTQKICYIELKK